MSVAFQTVALPQDPLTYHEILNWIFLKIQLVQSTISTSFFARNCPVQLLENATGVITLLYRIRKGTTGPGHVRITHTE
jgi:hypothetical protein